MSDIAALRVAWWSPLPPQKSGISDYSFDLIGELSKQIDIIAVVRDDVVDLVRAPAGVEVVGATRYRSGLAGQRDLDVYQMGNQLGFHGYMHAAILESPGLLVLHDLALLTFYATACGDAVSSVLFEEAFGDDRAVAEGLPTILVDGEEEPDRLRVPLARRLVEASLLTIVHSEWARDELARMCPGKTIRHVHQPAKLLKVPPRSATSGADQVVFGIFGSLERHKRVPAAVEAFAHVHKSYPAQARLVVAGRVDNPAVATEVEQIIRSGDMDEAVRVLTDVPLEALEAEIAGCDVAIALRWPTNGEVSASLMRALGAGKPAIVSDVPQYRDLDPLFYWKVPTEPTAELRELEAIMRRVLEHPESAHEAGRAARRFVKAKATLALSAENYLHAIAECRALLPPAATTETPVSGLKIPGVNVIADWQSTTGLAESARRSVAALLEAGVTVAADGMQEPGAPRDSKRIPVWLKELPQGRPHEIDICYLNVNELSGISADELRPPGTDNYLVGYWFWELPTLAKAFVDQVKRVDEIWVGSNFTREALLGHTDGPIHVMPCVVNDTPAVSPVRKDLDLPEGPCIFFFHFDACSTFARKNPWAIIRAFRMAFTAQERSGPVRLVIKTINLSRTPVAAGERLVRELQLANGILLDMELSRDDMASLIASIDVYVSLHRSEGFGLGIAEAMLAKRPAIATAYSGNLEFMTHRNSCLVGYKLVSVTNNETHFNPGMEVVYEPGQLWAEPDIAQAARWMRMLYENPSARKRIGAAGAETIRTRHSAAAAGAAAAARLSQIAAEQGRLTRSARARAHARDLKVVARVRSERN